MIHNGMRPIHPGEILREEFLHPLKITPAALARELCVSAPTVNEIVREKRNVSSEVAVRLSLYFNTTADFWMRLQDDFEIRTIETGEQFRQMLREIKPLPAMLQA